MVVDRDSADPGLGGVLPVPVLEADHFSTCKYSDDSWVYKNVRDFLAQSLGIRCQPVEKSCVSSLPTVPPKPKRLDPVAVSVAVLGLAIGAVSGIAFIKSHIDGGRSISDLRKAVMEKATDLLQLERER